MKKLTLFAIVIIHVVVLTLVVGPCSGPRSGSDADQEPGGGGPDSVEKEDSGSPGVGRRDGGLPEERKYTSKSFAVQEGALPSVLRGQTDICRTGVVVDWTGKRVLWQKAASTSVPIASLTKMMTVWIVTEELAASDGLSLNTQIQVTAEASKIGGRQVWLDPRETFTVDELLKCILIRSANDCAYLVAQHIGGGNHAAFVTRMNAEAKKLGLSSLHFYNSHGLPPDGTDHENSGNALELAYLAGLLLSKPEVVRWSSVRLDYIREKTRPFQLVSTNKLLERVPGVNGMKTGYTRASGYCIVATCERNGRKIVVVATGCPTGKARDALVEALLEWAYALP